MKKNKAKIKLDPKEIVWIVIASVFGVTFLTFISFHFIAEIINNAGVKHELNALLVADDAMRKATKMGWLYWGLIALAIGVTIILISLNYFAKVNEQNIDREKRRKERMKNISEDSVVQVVEEEKAQ